MSNDNKETKRTCYRCHKEIPDVTGKYFCSKECYEEYGKDYKPLKQSKMAIKEMQRKLLEMGKRTNEKIHLRQTDAVDSATLAEAIFESKAE